MKMKKILILLFLLAPLFVSAQSWFTADAVSVGPGNSDGEWYECYVRVFSDKDGNVKIYTPDNTLIYRRIGDNYTKVNFNARYETLTTVLKGYTFLGWYVTNSALTTESLEAVKKAYSLVTHISFENAFYRNDIGKKALDIIKNCKE